MKEEFNNQQGSNSEDSFDVIAFVNFLLKHWYYLVVGILIGGAVSFLVIRYSIPKYEAKGQVLINVNRQEDPLAELTQQGLGGGFRNRFMNTDENDLLVFRSSAVSELANEKLPLQVRWFGEGRIRGMSESDARNFGYKVRLVDNVQYGSYEVIFKDKGYEYQTLGKDSMVSAIYGQLNEQGFSIKEFNQTSKKGQKLLLVLKPIQSAASDLRSALNISPVVDDGSVYGVRVDHAVSSYAIDYINAIMDAFIEYSKEEKRKSYDEALDFVEQRINEIGDSLLNVEQEMTRFRVANKIINAESKGQLLFTRYQQYLEEVIQMENQLRYLGKVEEYLTGMLEAEGLKPPIIVGLENSQLNSTLMQIQEAYTQATMDGVDLKLDKGSPVKERLDAKLEGLNSTLEEVVVQLQSELNNKLFLTRERLGEVEKDLGIFPVLEQQMVNIKRRYEMFLGLFTYLSEKKLDIGIRGSTVLSDHKIIEYAKKANQISPNSKKIFALGLSLGTSLPVLALFLLFYFDNRLKSVDDVVKSANMP
ncbi:MAG: GumC family protein, partial [Bacteroidia bacterium]